MNKNKNKWEETTAMYVEKCTSILSYWLFVLFAGICLSDMTNPDIERVTSWVKRIWQMIESLENNVTTRDFMYEECLFLLSIDLSCRILAFSTAKHVAYDRHVGFHWMYPLRDFNEQNTSGSQYCSSSLTNEIVVYGECSNTLRKKRKKNTRAMISSRVYRRVEIEKNLSKENV
jgi:hypothetical protein